MLADGSGPVAVRRWHAGTVTSAPPSAPPFVSRVRARVLTALAGDPTGMAPYVRALAEGDDAGHFAEDGPAWTVHAGMGTLVAGIRALLLQALHPSALAGVHDCSRYRDDPIGRLTGTVRWVITLTYGSTTKADAETARVGRFHCSVLWNRSADLVKLG